jgi:hypothetical protein
VNPGTRCTDTVPPSRLDHGQPPPLQHQIHAGPTATNDSLYGQRPSEDPQQRFTPFNPRGRSFTERIREDQAQQQAARPREEHAWRRRETEKETQMGDAHMRDNLMRRDMRGEKMSLGFADQMPDMSNLNNDPWADVLGTSINKRKKKKGPLQKSKSLSHVSSIHTSSMSSRAVSYTISEDYTKPSMRCRSRFKALEDGTRRILIKPSGQAQN